MKLLHGLILSFLVTSSSSLPMQMRQQIARYQMGNHALTASCIALLLPLGYAAKKWYDVKKLDANEQKTVRAKKKKRTAIITAAVSGGLLALACIAKWYCSTLITQCVQQAPDRIAEFYNNPENRRMQEAQMAINDSLARLGLARKQTSVECLVAAYNKKGAPLARELSNYSKSHPRYAFITGELKELEHAYETIRTVLTLPAAEQSPIKRAYDTLKKASAPAAPAQPAAQPAASGADGKLKAEVDVPAQAPAVKQAKPIVSSRQQERIKLREKKRDQQRSQEAKRLKAVQEIMDAHN